MNEEEIRKNAIVFAKKNKIKIAKELVNPIEYLPDKFPISVFMSGSPGAGKTELSKRLIDIIEKDVKHRVVRVDGDEIRYRIPGYTGSNSYLFQGAISLIVEKMHDLLLHNNQSFIFDSTMSNYEKAVDNINRSIDKSRAAFLFYVYQRPEIAWKFTQAREKKEGRNIPKEAFIKEFFNSRDTVEKIMLKYGNKINTFLVKKDFITNNEQYTVNLTSENKGIDEYILEKYNRDDLNRIL